MPVYGINNRINNNNNNNNNNNKTTTTTATTTTTTTSSTTRTSTTTTTNNFDQATANDLDTIFSRKHKAWITKILNRNPRRKTTPPARIMSEDKLIREWQQQSKKAEHTTVPAPLPSDRPRLNLDFLTKSDPQSKYAGGSPASEKTTSLGSSLFLHEISTRKFDAGNLLQNRPEKIEKQPSFLLRLFDSLEQMEQSVYTQELLLEKQRKQQSLAQPQSLQSPGFGQNSLYNLQTLF